MLRQIILVDKNAKLIEFWRRGLADLKYVKICTEDLDKLDFSAMESPKTKASAAVVSPGNSFGWLGGGFDLALQRFFGGPEFETYFRQQLGPTGYKPVGTATVVELGTKWSKNGITRVIHVPTVVAPSLSRKVYDPARPVETGYGLVFNTLWSALTNTPKDAEVLVVPGLATGFAGVPVEVCSKAMELAIRLFQGSGSGSVSMSLELRNVIIMQFLGYRYNNFVPPQCLEECARLGINTKALLAYDACKDPIASILPQF
ncbi:LAME_0G16644g1_1 [Lachancea meyersii CBS 8951]|uniref:LAME_0G16644g1_1 n=1 Tax=Lachancea meyersii CBS 8951 TaxID=1266667 RepID=A0A1G4KBF3_9SACH|nr:LAME_0G16644g1_1 [Lachancea meyersii CBS 8951]